MGPEVRKIFTFACVFLSITAAAEDAPRVLDLHDIRSYESLTTPAQQPIMDYFIGLESKGMGQGLYLLNGNLMTQLVARLAFDQACVAVFCYDSVLRERLRSEKERGRLILMTHGYSGMNGSVLSDEWPQIKDFKRNFAGIDQQLNLLVASPSTTLDILEHELKHAADFESGALAELYSFTRGLVAAGKLAEDHGGTVMRFVLEVRAYDLQRKFVETNSRPTEFLYRPVDVYFGEVKTLTREDYRRGRLNDIEHKVTRSLVASVFRALYDPLLPVTDRDALYAIMKRLMPQDGPYTFAKLILDQAS